MITGIELVFNSDELLSIEKTRDQIVYLTEKAVAIASSHPQAEEFFEVLPVPAELFRIAIIGIRPKPEDREHLHSAGIMEGLISYSVVTPDPRWSNLIDVHEETFEEARAIVRGGKPS
ncbi:MAG: hypothetical protein H7A36_04280 [Chlamydiales bacterium]|nr:hypothetical protein [Chlamydiales bacterium]